MTRDATRTEQASALGRDAETPDEIGWRGWRKIAIRLFRANGEHNLSINAAGVAFYSMFAIFPTFTALVLLYGLIADPADVQAHFRVFRTLIPAEGWDVLNQQLTKLTQQPRGELGWALAVSLAVALWSSGAGVRALMSSLNVVYGEREKRNIVVFFGTAVVLTLGGIVAALTALGVIVGTPIVLRLVLLDQAVEIAVDVLVWIVLAAGLTVGLAVLFRYGPSRRDARLAWISPGSMLATVIWVAASVGFSLFVRYFGNYEAYGAAGAILVLLMWFWVSAYVVLIGAELNAQLELQTKRDSTVGPPRPMGERGAFVADNVANGTPPDPKDPKYRSDRQPPASD